MAFDVFISYSSKDKTTADPTCGGLETAGIRCWIAPRDIRPGLEYAAGIIEGIDACRIMVLIFSSNSNASPQIHREIERAVSKGLTIIPFRIEEIVPTQAMEYYLGSIHWLDALTPPLAKHLQQLTETVKANLQVDPVARSPSAGDNSNKVPIRTSPRSKQQLLVGSLAALLLLCVGTIGIWTNILPNLLSQAVPPVTRNQQILLNIVHASYNEPFYSTAANSATLKPVNLSALSSAILAGYPPELLFWLFTDQFQIYVDGNGLSYRYNPPDDYGCPKFDQLHRCYVDWVHVATILGLNVQQKNVGAAPNAITYSRFCFEQVLAKQAMAVVPDALAKAAARQLDLAPSAIYAPNSPLSCQSSWDPTATAGQAQLGVPPLELDRMTANISPRSVEGMIGFLGTLLRLQRDKITPSSWAYVPPGRDYVIAPPTLITVHEDPQLLTIVPESKGCFVKARLNDIDYCVPTQATTTKKIFGFLIQVLGYPGVDD